MSRTGRLARVGAALLGFALAAAHPAASAGALDQALAAPATTVLYAGTLGTLPGAQSFDYFAVPGTATQTAAGGVTTLDTTALAGEAAGYSAKAAAVPTLDRAAGYALTVTAQLQTESHAGSDKDGDGLDDRAGFSVIVLSSDLRGLELGFWTNRVWAQADGAAVPPTGRLFTQAEGAVFDTTRLVTYTLFVRGDTYTLAGDGQALLTGDLRDYTAFTGFPDPYETPNLIFLGDDTTSASAAVRLARVEVTAPLASVYLPFLAR